MIGRRAIGMALALGAAACHADPGPPAGLMPLDGPLPAVVANRTPLPGCGFERAGQSGPWNEAARWCFVEAAAAGRPAEFATRVLSVEGDPIQFVYRVLGPGSFEVFVDATRDAWGSGRWEAYRCTHLAIIQDEARRPDFSMDDSCRPVAFD